MKVKHLPVRGLLIEHFRCHITRFSSTLLVAHLGSLSVLPFWNARGHTLYGWVGGGER